VANPEHLAKLREGVEPWNEWREQHPKIRPDLTEAELTMANLFGASLFGADLRKANLFGADLRGADLVGAVLTEAQLSVADLRAAELASAFLIDAKLYGSLLDKANLSGAKLVRADLSTAHLAGANLSGVDLRGADLSKADLSGVDLTLADLSEVTLVGTNLEGTNLTGCRVYGIAAWNLKLEGAIQANLVITPAGESPIQVDNLEVAQFIYLLLNNQKIRRVIETITSKVVLILGRFTPERKVVLDAIRDELRKHDYLPVLFDFEKPANQTTEETIATLAHMSRFVIADITDAKSVLQELRSIVPDSPSVVVQPLLLASQEEPGMWDFFTKYPWVMKPFRYTDKSSVTAALEGSVIAPAEAKANELARR
jgi:uncharacterized protein YjbI with pentapeptide repeats